MLHWCTLDRENKKKKFKGWLIRGSTFIQNISLYKWQDTQQISDSETSGYCPNIEGQLKSIEGRVSRLVCGSQVST